MGRFNWWMPAWLDRLVPHVSIEGAELFAADEDPLVAAPRSEPLPAAGGAGGPGT